MSYVLLDNDLDGITANGEDLWYSPEECIEDIQQGLRNEEGFPTAYFPWTIREVIKGKKRADYRIVYEITNIEMRIISSPSTEAFRIV